MRQCVKVYFQLTRDTEWTEKSTARNWMIFPKNLTIRT